ncbi:hypothetical protein FKM95_000101 [Candidatus Tremblaya phenacola]|nr:hypothetical protein FKM95_000101 [Candidatus Tremblaya phenacola]
MLEQADSRKEHLSLTRLLCTRWRSLGWKAVEEATVSLFIVSLVSLASYIYDSLISAVLRLFS